MEQDLVYVSYGAEETLRLSCLITQEAPDLKKVAGLDHARAHSHLHTVEVNLRFRTVLGCPMLSAVNKVMEGSLPTSFLDTSKP